MAHDTNRTLRCYLDESGVEGSLLVATMAGLSLENDRFTWLDLEWKKVLSKHNFTHIHMREFGLTGKWGQIREGTRLALFTDIAAIIREHKRYSIAATLTPGHFKQYFGKAPQKTSFMSIYSTCFFLLAMAQGKQSHHDGYSNDIPFLLDCNHQYRKEIEVCHAFLMNNCQFPVHVGRLEFDTDEKNTALQAADVVAWAVQRQARGLPFNIGSEPIETVLDEIHLKHNFDEEWMVDVADGLKTLST